MAVCTKLIQWLTVGVLLVSVWAGLLTELLPVSLTPQVYDVILPVSQRIYPLAVGLPTKHNLHVSFQLPVYFLICFGVS